MAKNGERYANKLSALEVSQALKKGERSELLDGAGLRLIIQDKNKGYWQFRGRRKGDRTEIRIRCGDAPATSLSQARAKRDEYKLALRRGINPKLAERAARQQAERDGKTFDDVAEEYFQSRRDLDADALTQERRRIINHASVLRPMPIKSIRRADHIKPMVDALVAQGKNEQARRVCGTVGRIFRHALNVGYLETNCATDLVSMLPRRRPGEQKHLSAATDYDSASSIFQRLWVLLEGRNYSPIMKIAMKLTCYTPLRNGNIVGARWSDVDLDKKVWNFPETKNGRSYTLPMPRQVHELFIELRQYKRNSWCFPSGSKSGHITDNGVRKMLRDAGIAQEEQSLHGFRSTFQTIALEAGLPKTVTERLLFHVAGGAVEQAYNRARYMEPCALALQWWDDAVDAMRKGQPLPGLPKKLCEWFR